MNRSTITTMAILTLAVFLACAAFSVMGVTYNGYVGKRNEVQAKWAQIDNQLQRRADLIPNLVNTVKGYAAHESQVISAVANARAQLAGAGSVGEKAAANGALSGALSRLLVVVENYPNLKADAHFRDLMAELAGTENRIAVARMDYNEAVKSYNNSVQMFPGAILAPAMGFRAAEYFEVSPGAREVPTVDFSR